jgi:Zn-dependent protease with chaperone function
VTLEIRILTVGLAVFATVSLVAAFIVPRLLGRIAGGPAARRARRLSRLRLLPAAAGAGASIMVVAAFIAFEPRREDEYMGWIIPGLALLGALTWAAAGWRGLRLFVATRRTVGHWLEGSRPISLPGIGVPVFAVTSAFPIVAVIGLWRPRMIIADSVLDSCTPDELQAIIAHEQGHMTRRDNLRRWLMALAPDALAWLPASARFSDAWRTAAEEAADDDAERVGADGRISLASALVKVARLASDPRRPQTLPASALYCGEELDARVRRLLRSDGQAHDMAGASRRGPTLLTAIGAMSMLTLDWLHAMMEVAIHALP